jgi:alpha-galactosidase
MRRETKMLKPTLNGVLEFALGLGLAVALCAALPCSAQQLANGSLTVTVQAKDGSYQVATHAVPARAVLSARPGAEIDGQWVRSNDYPQHTVVASAFDDILGAGHQISVTCSGLKDEPDLVYTVQLYDQNPYATVLVEVQNRSGKTVTVQAIRSVEAIGQPIIGIDGPESSDRILSDSYSEDWPLLIIRDLGDGPVQMHRASWSQVIYNRESKQSLFIGALSANRFLTLLHLRYQGTGNDAKITSYTVDSTGTTELHKDNGTLRSDPPADAIDLSLTLSDGQSMDSERVMVATGADYHNDLLAYGDAVRRLQHARVTAPNLMGWWSWTAYGTAINEGAALTNAEWESEHLKSLGYNYFFIDEGYGYARGEYTTPNARMFPNGMRNLGYEVTQLGLTFSAWTAPFEVSNRSWVYENHKDWLVHTADGTPIPIVNGTGAGTADVIYALDTTHPGAQDYIRQTYTIMTKEWGMRLLKFDFMDTSSIEGYRYRPNTTATEAQRIGLEIIRNAVGNDVLLDKDGSAILPPVGIVDAGRVTGDTGHSYANTKRDEPGLAARAFYMNRNFFLVDPDAFNIATHPPAGGRGGRGGAGGGPGSQQGAPFAAGDYGAAAAAAVEGQVSGYPDVGGGQGGGAEATLSEAQCSIMLAAISGGEFEIGDDLPILATEKDRLALVENQDLIDMAKISRASTPIDLLSYDAADGQPSIFFLSEDPRQSILTVFNWTDQPRSHTLKLADYGLPADHTYQGSDVLNGGAAAVTGGTVELDEMPMHSVRVIKLIDSAVPAAAPTVAATVASQANVDETLAFTARSRTTGTPALTYHWDFGDGTMADGPTVNHAYTRDADFTVQLSGDGLDGMPYHQSFTVKVTGSQPSSTGRENSRYEEPSGQ